MFPPFLFVPYISVMVNIQSIANSQAQHTTHAWGRGDSCSEVWWEFGKSSRVKETLCTCGLVWSVCPRSCSNQYLSCPSPVPRLKPAWRELPSFLYPSSAPIYSRLTCYQVWKSQLSAQQGALSLQLVRLIPQGHLPTTWFPESPTIYVLNRLERGLKCLPKLCQCNDFKARQRHAGSWPYIVGNCSKIN